MPPTPWSALQGTNQLNIGAAALASNGTNIFIAGAASAYLKKPVYKWDGTSMTPLNGAFNNLIFTLKISPVDGCLYAGGSFTQIDATPAKYIAKYSFADKKWSAVGPLDSSWQVVNALKFPVLSLAFDADNNLYVAAGTTLGRGIFILSQNNSWDPILLGTFSTLFFDGLEGRNTMYAAGNNTGVWKSPTPSDPSTWTKVGAATAGIIKCIATDNKGSIYAGGTVAGIYGLFKSDGTSWKIVGAFNTLFPLPPSVNALAYDSTNDIMYAGGSFKKVSAGSYTYYYNSISQRKFSGINELWVVMGSGFNNTVFSLALDNNNILYAGGLFTKLGTASNSPQAFYVAKWEQNSTTPLSTPTTLPSTPTTFPEPTTISIELPTTTSSVADTTTTGSVADTTTTGSVADTTTTGSVADTTTTTTP